MSFFAPFSTDSKSASNYAFFDDHIALWKKLLSYKHFLQTLNANEDERAQKTENSS
jgi:hypothetical protein